MDIYRERNRGGERESLRETDCLSGNTTTDHHFRQNQIRFQRIETQRKHGGRIPDQNP